MNKAALILRRLLYFKDVASLNKRLKYTEPTALIKVIPNMSAELSEARAETSRLDLNMRSDPELIGSERLL